MIDSYAFVVAAPVAGQAVYCLAHVCACWTIPRRSPYTQLIVAFLPGLAATVGISLGAFALMHASWGDMAALMLLNLLTYLALAFGYFNFVNVGIASLRIRIIEELSRSQNGIARDELLASYNTEHVVGLRIARLVAGQHLREKQGRFYRGSTRRFFILAWVYDLLRRGVLGRGLLDRQNPPPTFPGTSQQGTP